MSVVCPPNHYSGMAFTVAVAPTSTYSPAFSPPPPQQQYSSPPPQQQFAALPAPMMRGECVSCSL